MKSNINANGIVLPYFCKACTYPNDFKEENKHCGDLCCHPNNNALETSADGSAYKFTQLINYNERKINKPKKWYQL
jgi:hypothetical protein